MFAVTKASVNTYLDWVKQMYILLLQLLLICCEGKTSSALYGFDQGTDGWLQGHTTDGGSNQSAPKNKTPAIL